VEAALKLEGTLASVGMTVADARFMKPLDEELIRELAKDHEVCFKRERE
jgi:deoxyxylulose-5-phosphate synthase